MMKKYFFLIFFFCATASNAQMYQLNTTFDSLFPMTWYQKGLEVSLSVWQALIHFFEMNDNSPLSLDELLGKLARTQFYINRMQQEAVLDEDKNYFGKVLDNIQHLVDMMVITQDNEDFILCAQGMIVNLHKSLHIP